MLKVYQIYFKAEQQDKLEKEFIPVMNPDCTVFFENQVIRDLVEHDWHLGCEYFGVVSHKLREKLGFTRDNWKNNPNIANVTTQDFTVKQFSDQLFAGKPDAMSFQRHVGHDTVGVADGFHPGFTKFWRHILGEIGMKWEPVQYENVFYCSFYVAKREIYEKFVKEMLAPAMDVMKGMPELYGNSRYPFPLPVDLQEKWGIKHYSFHPFICERFFTHWAHINNLKCLHY